MSASSASATLTPFNRLFKQQGRWASICWRRDAVNSWLFANSGWKGICLAASSTYRMSGGTAERLKDGNTLQSYSWPNKKWELFLQKPRICILGGGFGGLNTALRLESLTRRDDNKPQVLLIDQSNHFVFKPMLYELLSGEVEPWEIAPRFLDLLSNTNVQFYQDRVKLLHPSSGISDNGSERSRCAGTVHLESGLVIEYDWLVLALGAKPSLDLLPGAVLFALPFANLEDACLLSFLSFNCSILWLCFAVTVGRWSLAAAAISRVMFNSGCKRNWSTFEHIHTKKRNRIDQKRLNDLVYVKYNRTLLKRYEMRHSIDPISLNDIDESNEWLTRKGPEDPEDQPVYDDDQSLTWGQVASASGANDERFNLRSKGNKNGGQGSSQTQPLRIEEEYEEEEEDDEAYKSGSEVDGDIDAELALDDEDDLDEFDD